MFSATPRRAGDATDEGVDPAEFQRYFVKHGRFAAGTATQYAPSTVSGDASHQDRADGFKIGMRFHSAPVIRLADARPVQLGHVIKADGRWRLFLFADGGDPTHPASTLHTACGWLAAPQDGLLHRYTPDGADIDAVFDVRAVLQQGHRELSIDALPPLLRPMKGRFGLVDYEKVFCPNPQAGDIFDMRGIDRAQGCLVVVRPDQYVAGVFPLDAHREVAAFFSRFML